MKSARLGHLLERELLSPTLGLFRFVLGGGVPPFEAGQFISLGLEVDGQLVWRPYSLASAPEESRHVELLVRWAVHPIEGRLTTRLGRLREGDPIHWSGPKGHFTIRQQHADGRADRRRLLLIAAGTGVAPFASYLRHAQAVGQEREFVLLQGASYSNELAYHADFAALASRGRLRYLPTVSRPEEQHNRDWRGGEGRVERWLEPVRPGAACLLEQELGIELDPLTTCAHVCGPTGMASAVSERLARRGFRDRGHAQADGRVDLLVEAYG